MTKYMMKIQDTNITTDVRNTPDNKCTPLFTTRARKQQNKGSLLKNLAKQEFF